ncbi:MAG TPA: metallophosphoesterase [Rhizomicrobium sp.]|nr:metallophosphoesterase [Rhizomicrobium sp.]
MKKLLLLLLFLPVAARAQNLQWVQATAHGYEARAITSGDDCPILHTDKGDVPMAVRASKSDEFPLLCAAPLPAEIGAASVQMTAGCKAGQICDHLTIGETLPVPSASPQRILVLGDTGCRIKGAALQACNDPAKWPFPNLAAAAARLKPDLVIHVGDYLYRESACPSGNQGCAGSPWGDNWTTWDADFFAPAAPLLAAAPMVLTRGNHEDCTRAGPGFQLLLGPGEAAPSCLAHEPLYTVDLGGLALAVLDDADSDEMDLNRATAHLYAREIAGLSKSSLPVWLVHHRPTWAAISGPLGIPIGGNLTLMEASRINAQAGAPLIPHSVELVLSGHIHSFEAINYAKGVPPQIVAGNGGTNLEVTPRNLHGAQFLGHSGVTVADGLSLGGFGFLLMTRAGDGWTIDLYDSAGAKTRTCRFTAGAPGRVDC